MSDSLLFRVTVPARPDTVKVLGEILGELNVRSPVWLDAKENQTNLPVKQVLFYLENGHETEEAIRMLTENDIGGIPCSSIGLFQCYLLYQGSRESSPRIKVTSPPEDAYSWERFLDSVRPRLAIAEIVHSVKRKATLTFDFVILLTVAGLTASLGLVEDNQLILASSMFISPMMFPIIATTLGTVTRQWKLQKLGMTNGLLGLLVCLIIGFVFGVTASFFQGYKSMNEWPTSLMYSMGTVRALWTGTILAFFSGTAVSIGILGEDTGAIHGVAISAALLPPAVNAGLLWSRSAVLTVFPDLPDNSRRIWSDNPSLELALLGAVSLGLSSLNVIFIFIAGNLLLKVKEVASRRERRDDHWDNLRGYKPLTREETDHLTVRFGYNPANKLRFHHWTISPSESNHRKIVRGLETWSGGSSREQESRPTAQDMASHMLAPKRVPTLLTDWPIAPGSSCSLLTPPPVVHTNEIPDTSPNSRFTVVPVNPS